MMITAYAKISILTVSPFDETRGSMQESVGLRRCMGDLDWMESVRIIFLKDIRFGDLELLENVVFTYSQMTTLRLRLRRLILTAPNTRKSLV
jgi:hypothetical protein